jgi:hypothetical protein
LKQVITIHQPTICHGITITVLVSSLRTRKSSASFNRLAMLWKLKKLGARLKIVKTRQNQNGGKSKAIELTD